MATCTRRKCGADVRHASQFCPRCGRYQWRLFAGLRDTLQDVASFALFAAGLIVLLCFLGVAH